MQGHVGLTFLGFRGRIKTVFCHSCRTLPDVGRLRGSLRVEPFFDLDAWLLPDA